MWLFRTSLAESEIFDTYGFKELFVKESDIQNNLGQTLLMYACIHMP